MRGEVLFAAAMTAATLALWAVSPNPFVPFLAAVALVSVAAALWFPSLILLLFVIFSMFRLHEVFPVLRPLQIPLALSVLGIASVAWHLVLSRRIKAYLSAEMKALLVFALLVSLGVLTAKSHALAYAYWSENFIKVVLITFALGWTLRQPAGFRVATYLIVLSGLLVGTVTISNWLNGIGLVEMSRATVAREFGSPLGDPNILALTLTFSLSFCLSLLLSRTRAIDVLLGLVATGVVIAGVVCTQSRGGLLAVVAVLAVSATRVMKLHTILLFVIPVVSAGLYMAMNLSDRMSGGAEDMSAESASGRLYAWSAAINMALDRPFTGVGINNFIDEFYAYTDMWFDRALTAHSAWFQVLGETGFLGLGAFAFMIAMTIKSSVRAHRLLERNAAAPDMQAFAHAVTAGLAGFCVAGSFLSEAYNWALYALLAFSSAIARWASASANASHRREVIARQSGSPPQLAAGFAAAPASESTQDRTASASPDERPQFQ
jgi:probable O-glycosylation ligase (exosortase A-associated)